MDESELMTVGLGEGTLDEEFGGEEDRESTTCSNPSKCKLVFPQVPSARLLRNFTLNSSAWLGWSTCFTFPGRSFMPISRPCRTLSMREPERFALRRERRMGSGPSVFLTRAEAFRSLDRKLWSLCGFSRSWSGSGFGV